MYLLSSWALTRAVGSRVVGTYTPLWYTYATVVHERHCGTYTPLWYAHTWAVALVLPGQLLMDLSNEWTMVRGMDCTKRSYARLWCTPTQAGVLTTVCPALQLLAAVNSTMDAAVPHSSGSMGTRPAFCRWALLLFM